MIKQAIGDKTAIVGIGCTEFTKASGTSVLNLAVRACDAAIKESGIDIADVDGVLTFGWESDWERQVYPSEVARSLGFLTVHFKVMKCWEGGNLFIRCDRSNGGAFWIVQERLSISGLESL